MANKPLKTIQFPNLPDTYTVPQVDATLSVTGGAADAKVTGDTLAEKADKDGVIATAEGLIGGAYTVEQEPYHFRKTAVDLAGRLDETIVGGSLAWNQLITLEDYTASAGVQTRKNVTNVTFVSGHKYLGCIEQLDTMASNTRNTLFYANPDIITQSASSNHHLTKGMLGWIFTPSASVTGTFGVWTHTPDVDVRYRNCMLIDLTQMFGTTIADYIYSLEQATAGAGVAWVKRYIDLDTYHEYDAGSIKSVEGLESHNTYDEDKNLLASYPLDSSVTLRGVPKLVTNHLEFDGDRYLSDGTVERRYGERAYQSGDESLANAITDGTTTVYKLTTPTTESAQPFQSPMIVGATEEYISDSIVPVGHESKYYEDVAKKVSGLPKDFSTLIAPTEVTFTATRNYSVGNYLIVKNQLYKVTSAISSGGTITPNSNVTATTIMAEILALA